MVKLLVYKDKKGDIRHVDLGSCPVQAIQGYGTKLKNFLVSGGAPEPASTILALIRCK